MRIRTVVNVHGDTPQGQTMIEEIHARRSEPVLTQGQGDEARWCLRDINDHVHRVHEELQHARDVSLDLAACHYRLGIQLQLLRQITAALKYYDQGRGGAAIMRAIVRRP